MKIDDRELHRAMRELDDELRGASKDMRRRVLPRVARGARTDIAREVRKRYQVRSRALREQTRIGRVSTGSTSSRVTITLSDRSLPLDAFGSVRQNKRGVAVTVLRGRRQTIDGAFMLRGRVLKRRGKARLPLRAIRGPSLAQMASEVWSEVDRAVAERYRKDLAHLVRRG